MNEAEIVCYYRSPEVLADKTVQDWITNTLEAFARNRVKERLFPRLLSMAAQRHLSVNSVKVSSAKGRWGSCSTKSNINLSLYLVLLPRHLQDYVMLRELCHLRYLNHGPEFHALLESLCSGHRALARELKGYRLI
jgi:predicted metal-dependent hydrolase